MSEAQKTGVIRFYDTHPINEDEILAKAAACGASLDALTQVDLKDFDQDHYGGTEVLDALADAAGLDRRHRAMVTFARAAEPDETATSLMPISSDSPSTYAKLIFRL